jgi:hypothetical protein
MMMLLLLMMIIIIINSLYLRWIDVYNTLYNLMLKVIKFVLDAFRIYTVFVGNENLKLY